MLKQDELTCNRAIVPEAPSTPEDSSTPPSRPVNIPADPPEPVEPSVDAGPDRGDVWAMQQVTLTASYVPGAQYLWEQLRGPTIVLTNPNSRTITFRLPNLEINTQFEFRVSATTLNTHSLDSVLLNAQYGTQAFLYALHAGVNKLHERHVPATTSTGEVLIGYASGRDYITDGQGSCYGDESGAYSSEPLWDFQGRDGSCGAGYAYLKAYEATHNKAYLRKAKDVAEMVLKVQEELGGGWFQDGYYVDGVYKNVQVWGEWGHRRHIHSGIQNIYTLDDYTSTSCATFLAFLYENGREDRYLVGAKFFAGALAALQGYRHQESGLFPYQYGGLPQVLPVQNAFTTDLNQNLDDRNPDGPYLPHITLNDEVMKNGILFLHYLSQVTGDIRYMQSAAMHVDFLLEWQRYYGETVRAGWAWPQQIHWRTNEPAWGRGKEPPAFVTCENGIVAVLLAHYRDDPTPSRRAHILNGLSQYMDFLRTLQLVPGTTDKIFRYYNHDVSVAPLRIPTFARNFIRYFGAENEHQAGSGQPNRGTFDLAWVGRISPGGTGTIDITRFAQHTPVMPAAAFNAYATGINAYRAQDPIEGGWVSGNCNRDNNPIAAMSTATTVGFLNGLAKVVREAGTGEIVDSDGDGATDACEIASGTDRNDSDVVSQNCS